MNEWLNEWVWSNLTWYKFEFGLCLTHYTVFLYACTEHGSSIRQEVCVTSRNIPGDQNNIFFVCLWSWITEMLKFKESYSNGIQKLLTVCSVYIQAKISVAQISNLMWKMELRKPKTHETCHKHEKYLCWHLLERRKCCVWKLLRWSNDGMNEWRRGSRKPPRRKMWPSIALPFTACPYLALVCCHDSLHILRKFQAPFIKVKYLLL